MSNRISTIDVYLLAENRLLREALARILNAKSDMRVVGATAFSQQSVDSILSCSPHVLLFDCMPFALSDLGLIHELRQVSPKVKVVMIGMEPDREIFLRSVRDGAVGYVLKEASSAEVAAAVRAVANDQAVCPPDLCLTLFECVAQQNRNFPSYYIKQQFGLTRREQQLVGLIGRGLTNKEIAQELNVAEQTVKNHVHRMLRKAGASDRLALVELCRTQGMAS